MPITMPVALAAMVATSVAGVGTSIYEAVSAPKTPTMPSTSTTDTSAQQAEEAAKAQANSLLQRRGMAATMLQSPMSTGAAPSTQRATLGT